MINIIKRYGLIALIGVVFIITIVLYAKFSQTAWFDSLLIWSKGNLWEFIIILALIKIIAVVWPQLPGLVFTIAAIPIVGWPTAFLIDMIAGMTGASIAFGLSRKYGEKVVLKLFGKAGLDQVKRFQFNPDRELEAVLLTRFFTGALSELVNYGAGLTNIRFRNYILGTTGSYMVVGLAIFYLASFVFSTENLVFGVIPLVIGIIILYSLRKRYFIWAD